MGTMRCVCRTEIPADGTDREPGCRHCDQARTVRAFGTAASGEARDPLPNDDARTVVSPKRTYA